MKAASVYARLGWAPVPLHSAVGGVCSCSKGSDCPSAGKHPRIANWAEAATSDAATIAEWIARYPAANVGIATGAASGIWVLDVDPDNDGPATLAALVAEHGPLPVTAEQRTGSGGSHYLFSLPDFDVANSAGKLGRGLDVRGNGGQIVVAPSVSAKGPYRWVRPPWETAPAPAPAWLLELLRRRPPRAQAPERQTDGVTFPPASPQVLADVAEALAAHGPAVEGQGGDAHTWKAAAIAVNDFALSEAEAWPVLVEWNATCKPPWGEVELAAKMRGGARYASKPRGCARPQDCLAAVQLEIAAWFGKGLGVTVLVERCKPLAAACASKTEHALITNELIAATGVKARGLDLPPPDLRSDAPPGSIVLSPKVHLVADEATRVIAPSVFQRSGVLCEVGHRGEINDLKVPRIVDLMSAAAEWVRPDADGFVVSAPPTPVAEILAARRGHSGVRVLDAVTRSPVFLADGSILCEKGYSEAARVYLLPSVDVDVPDEPTRDDARRAAWALRDLLSDFHFASKADFSAWLAGLLSPLVKSATGNAPAPIVCVSASSPGAGKTLLTEVAAAIVTGQNAEVRPYNPRDPGEWGKRLTSYVRAASPISVFDNCNGSFGDADLDRLVTSSIWSDRVLGGSEAPPCAIVTTWWATGNNLEPVGDTIRRALPVRLEVDVERPDQRSGFKRPALVAYAKEHRAELLTAALTILRAYHVAGRPEQAIAPWGSFEAWSAAIRAPLVWLGLVDPHETHLRAARSASEPDNDAHDLWLSVIDGSDGSPASIVAGANAARAGEVLGVRDSITPYSLRKFVARFVDRPRSGRRIRRDGVRYYVERVA